MSNAQSTLFNKQQHKSSLFTSIDVPGNDHGGQTDHRDLSASHDWQKLLFEQESSGEGLPEIDFSQHCPSSEAQRTLLLASQAKIGCLPH